MIPHDYVERCYAGWLGKVIGVRYGAPIEGMTYEAIARTYGELKGYPVDYRDFAADDDTNGPLFFLCALEDSAAKADITCREMGEAWLNYIPYEHGMLWWGGYGDSTEHTAYLNLRSGIPAPESGSIQQNGKGVAEQIGGQIFSDPWGLICPGNPVLAADLAEKASRVSHDGEAVYAGRVVASAIAHAFVCHDIYAVLEKALSFIPQDCEYMRMARDIFAFYHANAADGWRKAMEHVTQNWGYDRYPGNCHVIPNSAVMLLSMLYGKGDFDETLHICNMCGWDTDCNAGNVGTIMGVLVGLEGISDAWRKPINDFLVASSVVGCMNITTLPGYVRRLVKLGYQLAGEPVPERWSSFVHKSRLADFLLPGSTCAMRLRGDGFTKEDRIENVSGVAGSENRSLKIHFNHFGRGEYRYVYHGTYYHPEDFYDSRYDPAFSPLVYPGQSVSVRLCSAHGEPLKACAYAYDGKSEYCGEEALLMPNEWHELQVQIPALSGVCITQVGVRVCHAEGSGNAVLYMEWLECGGKADYRLDFSCERMEQWPRSLHKEITQMTKLKGLWELWDGKLYGSCADFGEAYTGDVQWRNVEITCRWTPANLRGRTGFGARIQGAIRGYALLADNEHLYLCKNSNGYTDMASCPKPQEDTLEITLRCVEDNIEVYHEGKRLMGVRDEAFDHGMTGLVLSEGSRAAYEWLQVRVL